jgi:hypothetical protein
MREREFVYVCSGGGVGGVYSSSDGGAGDLMKSCVEQTTSRRH